MGGEEADQEIIPARIGSDELAATVGVADGVDGPGDMVVEEHPDKATPEESVETSGESAESVADQKGDQEAQKRPDQEGLADEDHQFVLQQGARVARHIG